MKSEKLIQDFFTVAEVADRTRVSQRTVRQWIADKLLPIHRFGHRIRISARDMEWFERSRREA